MKGTNKVLVIVLVLAVVIVGYFLLTSRNAQAPQTLTEKYDTTSSTQTKNGSPAKPLGDQEQDVVVTYTDAGYSPSTLTVKVGTTVIFANDSSFNMWTASGMHPSHAIYSGTSISAHCPDPAGTAFDACQGTAPGSSWSFTFNKKGSWGYHNHLQASHFGKVTVE